MFSFSLCFFLAAVSVFVGFPRASRMSAFLRFFDMPEESIDAKRSFLQSMVRSVFDQRTTAGKGTSVREDAEEGKEESEERLIVILSHPSIKCAKEGCARRGERGGFECEE